MNSFRVFLDRLGSRNYIKYLMSSISVLDGLCNNGVFACFSFLEK